MSIPQFLQDRLNKGRVVPFVGAGVSMRVLDKATGEPLFPSWRKLLLDAADRLDAETKTPDAILVRSLLNVQPPEFLEAAKRARQTLGAVWYNFLKDAVAIDFDRVDTGSLELARRIWRLGSDLVITTNYDDVLRWACPNQGDVQIWDIEAAVEQAFLLQQELHHPVVWHLHGHISNVAQLILSPDGYQLLYPDTNGSERQVKYETALNTLRNQIASKSLLFIGFSLDDEHLGLQLRGVHETYKGAVGPHYAIVRQEQAERVRSLNIEPLVVADFDASLMKLIDDLEGAAVPMVSAPVTAKAPMTPAVIPDYGPHRPVFYVPFKQKGDEIVGQQQVIEDVRKQLTEGKRTAIGQTAAFRGLGGLGKTQLAIEYAYRYRDNYPNGVIWINADQDIDAQLIEIAEKARWIAPATDHKYKVQIAQQRIRSYSDCLIVFDNLDDRRVIEPYLPEPEANPHILVTSRIDHVDFQPVPLRLLNEKLSRELLLKEAHREPETSEDEKALGGIVVLLGGLPLALELAGAYLGHRRTLTFEQYFGLLSKDLKKALPKTVSSFTKHEADLFSTLRLSEELLSDEDRLREVLDLLTWSGSAPMSTDLISSLLEIPNDGALAGALALGAELRLLQRSKERDSYSVHRLVGEVRRGEIPLEQRRDWVDAICFCLGKWFQEKREEFSELTRFESEIDHLKKWQENAVRFAPSHASRLMWLHAYPAYHRGRYIEARTFVIEAQRIFEQLDDTNLELKAHLLNDLGATNDALGEVRSVLANQTEALNIRREIFDESHPEVAASLKNVGTLYGKQGNLQRALEYSQTALAIFRQSFREPHPDIASALNEVGRWYGEQGALKRALEYGEEALSMRRDLFGERHPDLAASFNEVGRWYARQGNLERALVYANQALTIQRELFGERHPDIASSLNNVGYCYGQLGDLKQALQYSEQALAMRSELFGGVHPDIASSLNNVGGWYGELGDSQRELQCYEQALAMYRNLLGELHPQVATLLNNIGGWYGEQGEIDRALAYSKDALVTQRKLFGSRHPDLATSLNNIGRWYGEKGDVRRALKYSEHALRMRRGLFDQLHPDIANSLASVGHWYGIQGNLEQALEYLQQALHIRRQLFGERHPEIAKSLNNIAHWSGKKGDQQSALRYSQDSLTMYTELFGDRHPTTLNTATRVAANLIAVNQRSEAYTLVVDLLAKAAADNATHTVLKRLEADLLSKTIRPGFRQPSRTVKHKKKKRR